MANTNSAVFLFKKESSFRVDPTPTPGANAMLCTEPPSYQPEVTRITRKTSRQSLSPLPGRNGRITAALEFTHEVIGSGKTDASVAPPMDALLQCCGMARTDFATAGMVHYWKRPGAGVSLSLATSGTYSLNYVRYYTLTCTTGGASGTCSWTVTSPAMDLPDGTTLGAVNVTTAVMTNSSPFTVANGLTVTPTGVTGAVIGDKIVIMAAPAGSLYTPVSTGFSSGTGYIYYDGLLHETNGARGSWSMDAKAGEVANFKFSFKGDWIDPVDASIPTDAVVTEIVPPIVEWANVRADNVLVSCPTTFQVDMANETNLRECANAALGYAGVLITGRAPKISFDPDFNPEATYAYWAKLRAATEVDFTMNIGTERGNMCHVLAHMQFTGNQYGDRNGQRTYQISGEAVSRAGDDEVMLYFY